MTRLVTRAPLLTLLVILAGLGRSVVLTVDGSPSAVASSPAFVETPVEAWRLIDVGPGARSLVVRYEQGSSSCTRPATASVVETSARIRIRLSEPVAAATTSGCTTDDRFGTLTVPLRRPVAGRRIVQPTQAAGAAVGGGVYRCTPASCVQLMPRVQGLAPADARRVVRDDGFAGRVITRALRPARAGRPQVVRQQPRAHHALGSRPVVLFIDGTHAHRAPGAHGFSRGSGDGRNPGSAVTF